MFCWCGKGVFGQVKSTLHSNVKGLVSVWYAFCEDAFMSVQITLASRPFKSFYLLRNETQNAHASWQGSTGRCGFITTKHCHCTQFHTDFCESYCWHMKLSRDGWQVSTGSSPFVETDNLPSCHKIHIFERHCCNFTFPVASPSHIHHEQSKQNISTARWRGDCFSYWWVPWQKKPAICKTDLRFILTLTSVSLSTCDA